MRVLLLLYALVALASFTIAQGPLTGTIDYPQLGITFTVPPGWEANEGDGIIFIGSRSTSGLILMSVQELRTQEESHTFLEKGFSEDGIELFPDGPPQALRDGVATMGYKGKIEEQPAKGMGIYMLNPHGNGVSIIALALEPMYGPQLEAAAFAIMESLAFRRTAPEGPSVEQWERHLTNVRLTRIDDHAVPAPVGDTIPARISEHRIDLCGTHFTIASSDSLITDAEEADGTAVTSSGTWDVLLGPQGKPLLRLEHTGGERSEFVLNEQEGRIYLNGKRWFRTWEGEFAPDCD